MDKGGWSIADYLKSLEKGVGELLKREGQARSQSRAQMTKSVRLSREPEAPEEAPNEP
jgi:hypothetical protein